MALDKIEIGARIRKIREITYNNETRANFAERCGVSENLLGKIERGEILISVKTLNKICSSTGTESDYILFNKGSENILSTRRTINTYLDRSSESELKMYLKFISTIKGFLIKQK